jgi:CDP-diacylglycerol--glycerol-3-phosphate 3-phosphatidyltransferase
MAVYALRGRKRDADQEGKGAQLFLGFGDFLLHWFMWAIGPTVRASLRLGLTPDFYNFAGLFLGVSTGVALALGHLEAGGWLIALGGIADILDGRIARATGVASAYGDFVDSTFDRFVEVFAFLGLVVLLRASDYGALLSAAAMAGSILVSYARARGEALGVNCSGGLMQRGERLAIMALVCVLDPVVAPRLGWPESRALEWMLALMAASTFLTAAHRTVWIAARLRRPEKVS